VRVVLVTGKGGVGKTTLAAATAVEAAARGTRTLVASTDAAHSLGDVLCARLGADPAAVAPDLDAVQIDGRRELERSWEAIAEYLRRLLGWAELDRLRVDELVVIPGLDQLLALARLRSLAEEGRWDAIVVDCAPSADSLRLLTLPEVLRWYVDRLFGRSGMFPTWARRRMERTFSVPAPGDDVFSSLSELTDELDGFRSILQQATTTARIVVTPERVVVAEARRTLAYLALYGYAVDAVLVNRTPGILASSPPLERWLRSQEAQLATIDQTFSPVPRLLVRHRLDEPIGIDALGEIGRELYAEQDPLACLCDRPALDITTAGAESTVRVPVDGVERDDILLERVGDELVVTLGTYRRTIPLPDRLRPEDITRAGLVDGQLEIVFGGDFHVR
jgi:arsenite-transporting ATPase